jgi:hypothetical protein
VGVGKERVHVGDGAGAFVVEAAHEFTIGGVSWWVDAGHQVHDDVDVGGAQPGGEVGSRQLQQVGTQVAHGAAGDAAVDDEDAVAVVDEAVGEGAADEASAADDGDDAAVDAEFLLHVVVATAFVAAPAGLPVEPCC